VSFATRTIFTLQFPSRVLITLYCFSPLLFVAYSESSKYLIFIKKYENDYFLWGVADYLEKNKYMGMTSLLYNVLINTVPPTEPLMINYKFKFNPKLFQCTEKLSFYSLTSLLFLHLLSFNVVIVVNDSQCWPHFSLRVPKIKASKCPAHYPHDEQIGFHIPISPLCWAGRGTIYFLGCRIAHLGCCVAHLGSGVAQKGAA
jgi:hypothetical protein